MVTLKQKIEKCEGLINTRDVSDWENGFLKSIVFSTYPDRVAGNIVGLSDKQLEVLDQIYDKHFG